MKFKRLFTHNVDYRKSFSLSTIISHYVNIALVVGEDFFAWLRGLCAIKKKEVLFNYTFYKNLTSITLF